MKRHRFCMHCVPFIIRTLRLRFAPKFMKTYELKLEHPQALSNFTRSYTNECIKSRDAVDQVADDVDPV